MAEESKSVKQRLHFLDTLRGCAVIGMIFIHVSFDLPGYLGVNPPYQDSLWYWIFEQCVRGTFIGLSGYCCLMGRHPIKRGITVSLAGFLVTLVSLITKTDPPIFYGVLTLIGACMIISTLFRKAINKKNGIFFTVLFFLLFLATLHISSGYIGFYNQPIVNLPRKLYQANNSMLASLKAFIGLPSPSFSSSDYFPLMPWFFLFMSGFSLYAACGEAINKAKMMKWKLQPMAFLGKNALLVYLLHQPVIIGILMLISYIRR
jgi:uncharacterized membrane protein